MSNWTLAVYVVACFYKQGTIFAVHGIGKNPTKIYQYSDLNVHLCLY
jgi:hypothetical protein